MKNILSSMIILVVPSMAFAWGDLGHQAVGEIAERNLTPQAKKFVQSIMGVEPLAVSAIFPDLVRSDKRYAKHSGFHFVEIPQGFSYENKPRSAERDAHTIISQVPAILKSNDYSRESKMILFRYLVHVVGDVHMPFHVGNGVDMGANLCDVYWINSETGKNEIANLHTVWDEKILDEVKHDFLEANRSKIGGSKRYFGYPDLVAMILSEPSLSAEKKLDVESAAILKWYEESQELGKEAYPDSVLVTDPMDREYCKQVQNDKVVNGKYDATKVPQITREYVKKFLPLLKEQIWKAGIRLAAVLNRISVETGPNEESHPLSEEMIINSSLLKNGK